MVLAAEAWLVRANAHRTSTSAIVIGFVGGFVSPDDQVHSEVELATRLRRDYPAGGYVKVFNTMVPENVAQAANFFQPGGRLPGCPKIVAANPSRTRILGNSASITKLLQWIVTENTPGGTVIFQSQTWRLNAIRRREIRVESLVSFKSAYSFPRSVDTSQVGLHLVGQRNPNRSVASIGDFSPLPVSNRHVRATFTAGSCSLSSPDKASALVTAPVEGSKNIFKRTSP